MMCVIEFFDRWFSRRFQKRRCYQITFRVVWLWKYKDVITDDENVKSYYLGKGWWKIIK